MTTSARRAPRPETDDPDLISRVEAQRAQRRRALAEIVHVADPVAANSAITRAHFELSNLLDGVLGADAGANFHSWAVWGSRAAGRTIARHDINGLTRRVAAAALIVGYGLGWVAGLPPAAVAVLFAVPLVGIVRLALDQASRHVAHGNRMVLEEIGAVTIDFAAAAASDAANPGALDRFLRTLEPGPTERGGQDLLHRSFSAYAAARDETDRARRHQLVFAGNCQAVRHEHLRLQHDIARSMPWPLRRWITRHLLDFWVGAEHLDVSRDLPGVAGTTYPETLTDLDVPAACRAVRELRGAGRAGAGLTGSGAADWSSLEDRMNYVVDLFRSRHLSPEVFADPYPEALGCRSISGSSG